MKFAETGQLIRQARGQMGLTQAALAARLGMSRATISKLETGTIEELGVRKLSRLCDLLGLAICVEPRRALTLHENYEKNREERRAAFRETDAALARLNSSLRG